jgi:hypothetical protein
MVDRRPFRQAAKGKDTVISLDELLLSERSTIVLQPTAGAGRGSPIRVR